MKPIRSHDLWAAIERVARGEERGEGRGTRDEKGWLRASSSVPHDLIDARVLLAACGGDAAILDRLRDTFQARLPEQMQSVQEALRAGDVSRLREAAHKLCGMMATFSTVAGGLASELEDVAAGGDLDAARALVNRLETVARRLVQQVHRVSLDALR